MESNNVKTPRRGFLGTIAAGVTALSLSSLAPFRLKGAPVEALLEDAPDDADAWFKKIKGKHRIVFDSTHPHEIFPFAWPRVFLLTNEKTGTPPSDCGVVLVLRHSSIGYAFQDNVWQKYGMGEMFQVHEGPSKTIAAKNPFWKPAAPFKIPGFGEVPISIPDLQSSGVLIAVCGAAIQVYSTVVADKMKLNQEDVKKEWMANMIPNIQVVPSGVWAIGRAQEHGCGYCAVV